MRELETIFTKHGMNYRETMIRFINSENMYWRCYDMFLKNQDFEKLGVALKAKDLEAAFFSAHTLKGLTGNMGFLKLFQLVSEIVEPLRLHDQTYDYDSKYQEIITEAESLSHFKSEVISDFQK